VLDHRPPNAQRRLSGMGSSAHPHMLRHACGFALANKGHDTRARFVAIGGAGGGGPNRGCHSRLCIGKVSHPINPRGM
jgi:hypothetical protein